MSSISQVSSFPLGRPALEGRLTLKLAVAAERDMVGEAVLKERVRVGSKERVRVRVGIINVGKWRGRRGKAEP